MGLWPQEIKDTYSHVFTKKGNLKKSKGLYEEIAEAYVAALAIANPSTTLVSLGAYSGMGTKIQHRCHNGHITDKSPRDTLRGRTCGICAGNVKWTHEQYVEWITKNRTKIACIGSYVGTDTPILHGCKTCSYEWLARPAHIKKGTGCPKCAGLMKITKEEYAAWVEKNRPDLELTEDYVNDGTKIQHNCKTCLHQWKVQPTHIKQGKGCPQCAGTIKQTPEQYTDWLSENRPQIEALEPYVRSQDHLLHKCLVCEHQWDVVPNSIKQGKGCPKCANQVKDCLYWWHAGNNVFKIGVSGINRAQQRIEEVAKTNGLEVLDYEAIYLPEAYRHEQHLLKKLKTLVPAIMGDGKTEFRELDLNEQAYLKLYFATMTNSSEEAANQ